MMAVLGDTTTSRQELRFWDWWCAGVRAAGVRDGDLPELTFVADFGTEPDGERTVGVFQVRYDEASNAIRASIQLRTDLCSRVTVETPPLGGLVHPDVFAFTPAAAGASEAVIALALQCANYEQFAWRYWESGRRDADRDADRRAAALVRVWLAGNRRYRAPGYARGVAPVRYAERVWRVENGWLVAKD